MVLAMTRKLILALAFLFAMPVAAISDVLVLVPGYLSYGHTWRDHGSVNGLLANGWEDGGNIAAGPAGPVFDRRPESGGKRFYTVELPSEAPLRVQLGYLDSYINKLRETHPDERLLLAGHSAGGVLARYFMVTHPDIKVDALVTIASPHSGSEAAELGEFIGNTPMSWFAPMFGLDTLNRSHELYRDLGEPDPWSLLGWLNTQPHPVSRYISVIRPGDDWVETWSQDMNRVPALAGHSLVVPSPGDHELNPVDGVLLSSLFASIDQ